MRRRQLKWLWARLEQLATDEAQARGTPDEARRRPRQGARGLAFDRCRCSRETAPHSAYALNRNKLRQVRRREGRYLLRTNLCGQEPAELWQFYIQLTEIEAAFKNLKDDLGLRPIYHRLEQRIEAHIFVAFLAYCLHVTLRARLRPLAAGPHAAGRARQVRRHPDARRSLPDYRRPHADLEPLYRTWNRPEILAEQLDLTLPPQKPPKITAARRIAALAAPAL